MSDPQPAKLRYAWYVVIVLMLANVSSFIDRQILALLVGPIKRDLHLSDTEMSLLMGFSFALFYTLFGIFIGHFADKFNRRNIIIAGVTMWSLMTALCGGIKNYTQFFFARMGVGVGEATLSPSAYSLISDYFPPSKLSRALSTYSMGVFLGMGLAILVGAGLISALPTEGMVHIPIFGSIYPWQLMFFYIGLPGLLIALLVLSIKEPDRKETLEQQKIAKPSLSEALEIIWQNRSAYSAIVLGTSFTAFANYGTSAWVPTYFNRTFDWAMPVIGLKFGLIVTIFSGLGVLVGGWLADRYVRNGAKAGRVYVGIISGVGILVSAGNFLLGNPDLILLSLAVPAFFMAFPLGAAAAAVQELMPNRVRALASSIFLFFINMVGMGGGPYVVAFFTDSVFHDEGMIRYSLVALYLIGGVATILCFWLGLKPYQRILAARAAA
jgi:MFS family permease